MDGQLEGVKWFSLDIKDIYQKLYSSEKGLSTQNTQERQIKYGANELVEKKKKSLFKLFLNQFNNFLVWILIIATLVSFIVGERVDAIVIFVILVINALLGFIQEFKAEKSIEALKKLSALKATVLRDNQEVKIEAKLLVPGDIIILETGDKVPADARLIEVSRLEVDESSLTGESTPVKKGIISANINAPLGDHSSIVHSSTIVTNGRGKAIVVSTGMKTEIGKIAHLVEQVESKETPLQHKLSYLGEVLGIGTLIICAVVFIVRLLRESGEGITKELILHTFKDSIALAVAAIPEGFAAVVTVCLALGVQRMVKRNALVRVLPAVETLGSCDVICTDKTGTLTYNQMTVREIFANNELLTVTGQGYIPKGDFLLNNKKYDYKKIEKLLKIGVLCNDSKLKLDNDKWVVFGDPTEAALTVTAKKADFIESDIINKEPRIDEIPFDSTRKLMTTINKENKKIIANVKGAPDIIIEKCDRILINGKIQKLTTQDKKQILDKNLGMANKALRVLGFAYKELKSVKEKDIESKLIFTGLMGMIDPPRKEVIEAIKKCKVAGIKVVMITGDHKATAMAIGKELGLETANAMTGQDIDNCNNFADVVSNVTIYARVSPQHKMRIINALKSKKFVVSMTGDGVNDAPALKRADIGVAMGITGTDVAKEASDMILTDDNFTSIVSAVEEGRGIYDNIRKFVKYLLSSNLGEILTVFIAILVGFHDPDPTNIKTLVPLAALQLLWINILTDGLPALALGVEPTDSDVMKQKPRKSTDNIISGKYALDMIFLGIVMALGTLFVFNYALDYTQDPLYAGTMAFTTIVIFQLFNVLNCKSDNKSIFQVGIFNNKWLVLGILSSLILQLVVIYTPLSFYMKTLPLTINDWLIILCVSSTVLIFEEIKKFITRRIHHD